MANKITNTFAIISIIFFLVCNGNTTNSSSSMGKKREIIEIEGHDELVWIVQLSDLHFSVHHPSRAFDFQKFVGPALRMINPSLVFITGDLTDGKSRDLLTMKQDEEEWVEYRKVMENVVKRSGLNKSNFYDLRGNHDNFGVPTVGSSYDFFSKYSISGQLGRSNFVNSVTLQSSQRNVLLVAFDSTSSVGLRGPTNLFGHPTDHLLNELNSHLSQWDSNSSKPLTKIGLGHFPLAFSAPSYSKKTLKDIFLKQSISAYLCGHLHTRFGKNLKRHHEVNFQNLFQLNVHQSPSSSSSVNCSNGAQSIDEFWEWEMGDWRKSRAMRILAIDKGYVSFFDTDFKMGAKETLILPTYPLDSRYMSTSLLHKYKCQLMDEEESSHIRALVFSSSLIVSVKAKIYDSSPGNLYVVMETSMSKHGDLYISPWNTKAFVDTSPDRYWLEIEAIDINGKSTSSELRPFSMDGVRADLSWTWKEFFVMGCEWAALYYPIFWSFYFLMFIILLVPKAIISVSKEQYTYRFFGANKGFLIGLTWVFAEMDKIPLLWKMMLAYLFYLLLCPWLAGEVFTEGGDRRYMTYKGWVINADDIGKLEFFGFPDTMVVVLPHLYFVLFPAIVIIGAMAADRAIHEDHMHLISAKKNDDRGVEDTSKANCISKHLRSILLMFSLAVCWKHFKNCRALMKAYEMNPLLHFPFYSFSIPLLLAYVFYKTRRV